MRIILVILINDKVMFRVDHLIVKVVTSLNGSEVSDRRVHVRDLARMLVQYSLLVDNLVV
jgi:hypothetical protein